MSKCKLFNDDRSLGLRQAVKQGVFVQALNRKYIEIRVEDTGIGLSAEDIKIIFDPFEQVDRSPSRKYQGTGLGLSLTKQLIELHGGKIWAESKGRGYGCQFRFILPI